MPKHVRIPSKFLPLSDKELVPVVRALAHERPRVIVVCQGTFFIGVSGDESVKVNNKIITPAMPPELARLLNIESKSEKVIEISE